MPKIIFYNTVVKYKDNYWFFFFRILHSFTYHIMRYFLENAAFYYLKFTLFYIGRFIFSEEKLAIITYPSRIRLNSGFRTLLLHFFPYTSKDASPSSSPTARRFWRKKSMCECCRGFFNDIRQLDYWYFCSRSFVISEYFFPFGAQKTTNQ